MPKLSERSRAALNARSAYPLETYKDHGFEDRADYVQHLVDEYGLDMVRAAYSVMGPEEDFDGIASALEDFADCGV